MLEKRVIEPILEKSMKKKSLKKPVLVITITDGQSSSGPVTFHMVCQRPHQTVWPHLRWLRSLQLPASAGEPSERPGKVQTEIAEAKRHCRRSVYGQGAVRLPCTNSAVAQS